MKKGGVIIGFILVMVFVAFLYSYAAESRGKTIPSSTPRKSSTKVERFLKEVEKAGSLEDLGKAFKGANFSQAELRELGGELKKPLYSNKLLVLKQKRKQELNSLNQQIQVRLQSLKAKSGGKGRDTILPSTKIPPSETKAFGKTTAPSTENMARITSFTPQPVLVGQNLTLLGENFGNTRGRTNLDIEGLRVSTPIVSWRETHIVVTIPAGLEEVIGDSEKEGRLWIGAERNEMTAAVRIAPDPSRLTPVITSRFPIQTIITPGSELLIEGRNFLTRPGAVNFRLTNAGITYSGTIRVWSDTAILVKLREDIEGVQTQNCEVEVINHLGHRATFNVLFMVYSLL